MMLFIALLVVALIYVRIIRRLTLAQDTTFGLALCALGSASAMYNVWLFVGDMMLHHYPSALIDTICFSGYAYIFSVYWYKLDVQLFREKPGIIAPGRTWVFTIDSFMYLSPSFTGLAKQVVTEWCDDKHLVG